ncbi:MAG: substrate-binding domain-containing protein [Betaproteobacteria bacterium]|nr:substrate-binding domain-containing protein [Betaproteobacteria bacterium]
MNIGSVTAAATFTLIILLAQSVAGEAAEIKVLCANAMGLVMNELGPQFERATGHKLVIQFDVNDVLKRQIDAGDGFDVAILTTPTIDNLAKGGKIAASTRADIARSGIGVIVRSGAPKPDISSAEAFKRALLNARSITLTKNTPSASYVVGLTERLRIAEQMKPKTRFLEGSDNLDAVAAGEAELGFVMIGGFAPMAGVELLGPLPPELQNYVGYTVGVGVHAKEGEAGKAFINFLKAPAAVPVLKAKGMEPITP